MDGHGGQIPSPSSSVEEKQLFLHENMVNFVNQYSQPIIEVSLVVSKYIRIILEKLQETASLSDETLPIEIFSPRELQSINEPPILDSFPLERVLESVDQDRIRPSDSTRAPRTESVCPSRIARDAPLSSNFGVSETT